MKLQHVPFERLRIDQSLARKTRRGKFLHLLELSIREIGLSEPLKVAPTENGGLVVIDGVLRHEAIKRIRSTSPGAFSSVPVIAFDFTRRYEIRFQTDIFQDLLPSQLAQLVEFLHSREGVTKREIAASLGVAPATLRNYTGVWRLAKREGVCRDIVELMDAGILPSSNPFAWLRLTDEGVQHALAEYFADNSPYENWIREVLSRSERPRFSLAFVESVTGSLPDHMYRTGMLERQRKQTLGLRRADHHQPVTLWSALADARNHLDRVIASADSGVLANAAASLRRALK